MIILSKIITTLVFLFVFFIVPAIVGLSIAYLLIKNQEKKGLIRRPPMPMKIDKQLKKPFTSLSDVMIDSDVPSFFKRATGRDYKSHETCVNDIRRICGMYFAEEIERRINALNAEQGGEATSADEDI